MPIPVDQQMANILTDMGHAVLLCMHRARAVTTKLVFPGILYSRVNKLCKHSHTVLLLVLISSQKKKKKIIFIFFLFFVVVHTSLLLVTCVALLFLIYCTVTGTGFIYV